MISINKYIIFGTIIYIYVIVYLDMYYAFKALLKLY